MNFLRENFPLAYEFFDLTSQNGVPATIFLICLSGVIGVYVADEETTFRNSWRHGVLLSLLLLLMWWGGFFDGLWIRYE